MNLYKSTSERFKLISDLSLCFKQPKNPCINLYFLIKNFLHVYQISTCIFSIILVNNYDHIYNEVRLKDNYVNEYILQNLYLNSIFLNLKGNQYEIYKEYTELIYNVVYPYRKNFMLNYYRISTYLEKYINLYKIDFNRSIFYIKKILIMVIMLKYLKRETNIYHILKLEKYIS